MLRIFALLLLLSALARAEELPLEAGCAITLPPGEQWQRSFGQKISDGEVVLQVTRVTSRQILIILMLPNLASNDVMSPSVTNQLLRMLTMVNSKAGAPELVEINGQKFAQFIGSRGDAGTSDMVSLARATMRGRDAFLIVMFAPSKEESPAADKQFTQVLDTFRLVDPDPVAIPVHANPLFSTYQFGWIACSIAAGGLLIFFCITMLATMRREH